MFIDVSRRHADSIMMPFEEAPAEHYGYLEQLDALDLREEAQALFAIRRWLLPGSELWTPTGRYQRREICRFLIAGCHWVGNSPLPGIGTAWHVGPASPEIDDRHLRNFQLLLWRELFPEEPYAPNPRAIYRQRVDAGFEQFPDWPEHWGAPAYEPWSPAMAGQGPGT